ncbi:MAG: hypothetical protein F4Y75_01415 [Acidimicrobiia bacterium]|nr:hypothetical protein [Acidimicrobiia bacterium]MYF26327.1 hypothetical protein [Acidimicrobiia bacterium]
MKTRPPPRVAGWLRKPDGRNAPTRGEDFRVRLNYRALAAKAPWRVVEIECSSTGQ